MFNFAYSRDNPGSSVGDRLEEAGKELEGAWNHFSYTSLLTVSYSMH